MVVKAVNAASLLRFAGKLKPIDMQEVYRLSDQEADLVLEALPAAKKIHTLGHAPTNEQLHLVTSALGVFTKSVSERQPLCPEDIT